MQLKRYTLLTPLFFTAALILSVESMAQRRYVSRGGMRAYHHHPYYPVRVFSAARPFVSIQFGGIPYRYQHGYFYRPYGASFRAVLPPIGMYVHSLPVGYRPLVVGRQQYYSFNDVFYKKEANRGYQVVSPPLGSVVRELPSGAKVIVVNGQQYYEFNGTYLQEENAEDEESIQYRVVGIDGVLNTGDESPETEEVIVEETKVTTPQIGDRFENLPQDAKAIVIDSKKLYVSPAGYYYKEINDSGRVYYEVVGQ